MKSLRNHFNIIYLIKGGKLCGRISTFKYYERLSLESEMYSYEKFKGIGLSLALKFQQFLNLFFCEGGARVEKVRLVHEEN